MPRTTVFYHHHPLGPEKNAMRRLCAKLAPLQHSLAGKDRLRLLFDPIEPPLIAHLLHDIARGTGYAKSPLSLVMGQKAYYLRKNHVYYRIHWHMQADLREVTKGVVCYG